MEKNKNIGTNGGYQIQDVIWHQHSNKLLIEIMKLFTPDIPVIDLGCGHNWYMNTMKFLGYDTIGIDSVPLVGVDVIGDITDNAIQGEFGPKKRNVLSLEVGEHIPADIADNYLDNICMFGGDIILSWAIPNQDGIGHINCQSNNWVIDKLNKRGYKIDEDKTVLLRSAVADCHCNWFKHSLMYFTHKFAVQ